MSLTKFTNGQEASASVWMTNLNTIRTQIQTAIDNIESTKNTNLVLLKNQLDFVYAAENKVNKVLPRNGLAVFFPNNFSVIDQNETTAEVRIDGKSISLAEMSNEQDAIISSVNFSSTNGTIETLNNSNNYIYRVLYPTSTPTVTFDIQLNKVLNLSVLTFDISGFVGTPVITASASKTGVTYTNATSYALSASRLVVIFSSMDIQYIKLQIKPSAPDNLGGNSYTFGITDFFARSTEYQLVSDFQTLAQTITPSGANYELLTDDVDSSYYIQFIGQSNFTSIIPSKIYTFPSAGSTSLTSLTCNGSGVLHSVPSNIYFNSIKITDSSGNIIPIVKDLYYINTYSLNKTIASLDTTNNRILLYPVDTSTIFNLYYEYGPSSLQVICKVHLSSSSHESTPIITTIKLMQA